MKKILLNTKIISIITSIFIIYVASILCVDQYQYFLEEERRYNTTHENIERVEKDYLKTVLYENKIRYDEILSNRGDIVQYMIKDRYNSDNQLKDDIINPKEDSELSYILNSSLNDLYANVDNKNNRTFVMSQYTTLWNRCNNTVPTESNIIPWESYSSYVYNKDLAINATEIIKNVEYNTDKLIYWQCGEISPDNNSSKEIKEISIDALYNLYKSEKSIDIFKNYELLVPYYITNTGDIFGTDDINAVGKEVENYKIIIIQRINIYDALKDHTSTLNILSTEKEEIELNLYSLTINKLKIIGSGVVIIIILFFISTLIQNNLLLKARKRNER